MAQDKTITLAKHLEKYKNRLASGMIPERQADKREAYIAYVKAEIKRTEKTLEDLALAGVGKKK